MSMIYIFIFMYICRAIGNILDTYPGVYMGYEV